MLGLTTATLSWFDDGCCDVRYLDEWNQVPVAFHPEQVGPLRWDQDHHQVELAPRCNGRFFQHARDLLLQYRFYPPTVAPYVSDFRLERRQMQPGDRIVQRFHLLRPFGIPVVDVIGMTEVDEVMVDSRRVRFSIVTTTAHVIEGKWTAELKWEDEGTLTFTVTAVFRPAPAEPRRNHAFIRSLQTSAHRRGLDYFCRLVG